jgi:VTC domain
LEAFQKILTSFTPIMLHQLGEANLMNRIDEKYIINQEKLAQLFECLIADYHILEINSQRIASYFSSYFDTPNLLLFQMHHAGKSNRYKVRFRNYLNSETSYFEIKKKDNHGRTIKSRIESTYSPKLNISENEKNFLESNSPIIASSLNHVLNIFYNRITLIKKNKTERITIDLDLKFEQNCRYKTFEQIAIVELKQEKSINSPVKQFFKNERITKGGISKYCLGIILFFENIKYNRFKPKYNKIYKPYQAVS